jgi:hypothetical protein
MKIYFIKMVYIKPEMLNEEEGGIVLLLILLYVVGTHC